MKVFSPCFLGEIYLFCKGADSSIFPRVTEGKVDQIQSRVERNAVVRRRGVGGVLVPLLPWRGVGVGGRQEGAACPPAGHRPPQPSVGVWWLEGRALRPE